MMTPPELPGEILAAIRVVRATGHDGSLASAALWMGPSWRAAQDEGMDSTEFGQWIKAGLWNLAGDPATLEKVGVYRLIGGSEGWKLALAKMNPMDALLQFYEEGAEAVLDTAEVFTVLSDMGDSLPVEDQVDRSTPIAPHVPVQGPLNFG